MPRLVSLLLLFTTMSLFSSATPLPVGASAPLVSAVTDTGATLDLSTVYSENNYTLVFFYPKADTPGCTNQACSLRDAYETLSDKGVAVIGVSTDSVENQRDFKAKHRLPYTLLADKDKKVMKAFGVPGLILASRQAYLLHEGKIVYADHKGSTTKQAEDVLRFLAEQE